MTEIKKREKEEKNAMVKKMAEEFSQKDGASKAMAMLLMTAYSEGMEAGKEAERKAKQIA